MAWSIVPVIRQILVGTLNPDAERRRLEADVRRLEEAVDKAREGLETLEDRGPRAEGGE